MKKIYIFLFVLLSCIGANLFAQQSPFYADLAPLKEAYDRGELQAVKVVSKFLNTADELLDVKPWSVVDKKQVPPSGDKRDYYSLSTYWWPDLTKSDGLPYIRKDGLTNPAIYDIPERKTMDQMSDAVETLCVAYWLTGKEDYAKKAASFLRNWFTDGKKGMNPNMTYAQLIPGHTALRGTGILDARCLGRALNASKFIEGTSAWTEEDKSALQAWAGAFCYWLEHSTHGRKEHASANNHGIWFDALHLMVLSYLEHEEDVKAIVRNDLLPRLDAQIADDGSLPHELTRTRSLHYSTFVQEAMLQANRATKTVGIDLWKEITPSGKKVASMISFLYPYYIHPEKWTYPQILAFNVHRAAPVLYEVGRSLDRNEYVRTAHDIGVKPELNKVNSLYYYTLFLKK